MDAGVAGKPLMLFMGFVGLSNIKGDGRGGAWVDVGVMVGVLLVLKK